MRVKTLIVGSGIGGLAAAAELVSKGEKDFLVIDKCSELPRNLMNGLHYLHSCDFGTPFPFDFKKNPITEQIWDTRTNEFKSKANLDEMFEYSKKVAENLRHPSSIMDPGKRTEVFTPETNNMNDLIDAYYNYIGAENFRFGISLKTVDPKSHSCEISDSENEEKSVTIHYENMITTAPLNKFYEICGKKNSFEFKNRELFITNYKNKNIVPNWLIVLYMSDPKFPPYRITSFNGIISMESMRELTHDDEIIIKYIIGELFDYDLDSKTNYKWETGRIFGLSRTDRDSVLKEFIADDIYPIGRFGLWNGKLIMDSTILQAKEVVNIIATPFANAFSRIYLIKKLNEQSAN